MAMEVDFGFRPLTEPKPGQTVRKTAGNTIYRHCVVELAADGDVETRADGATGNIPHGVALNYAALGEEVIVCTDPMMKYVTTYTIAPNAVKADFGQFVTTNDNDNVKDAMNPHLGRGKVLTASAVYVPGTSVAQLLEIYDHPHNPVGDYTSAGAVDLLVTVRVLSELAMEPLV